MYFLNVFGNDGGTSLCREEMEKLKRRSVALLNVSLAKNRFFPILILAGYQVAAILLAVLVD